MAQAFLEKLKGPWTGFSRRDLFRQGGLLAAAQAFGGSVRQAVAAPMDFGADMYRSIGVRPVINARGTFTIITGSQTLPEVKRAMDQASRSFVNMDELMDGVSKRLAELTGAEWGIVTAGCCAAITHFTASAIAGGNPERMQRLPNLAGLKNEAILPAYSHNVYDHAIRMLGVKLVVVHDKAELEAAFNERTALCYILAGPGDDGPLGTRVVAEAARRRNVPVLVDAAAEILTVKPNVHLARGAHAVAYSGGKCIRGPQAAGLLLGEKSLLQGAWVNSAPHHAFGRSVKVGKEEIMGMLAAVEMWVKRDHKAEWAQWEGWLDHIATSVKRVDGVTTKVNQPSADLSNRTPELQIQWDGAKLGITGQEVGKLLLDTEPRIVVARSSGARPGNMASTVAIVPYQMIAGRRKGGRRPSLRAAVEAAENGESSGAAVRPACGSRRPVGPASRFRSRLGQPHSGAGAGRRQAAGDPSGRVRFRRSQRHGRRQYRALPEFPARPRARALLSSSRERPRAAKCREPSHWASMAKPVGQRRSTSIGPAADAAGSRI